MSKDDANKDNYLEVQQHSNKGCKDNKDTDLSVDKNAIAATGRSIVEARNSPFSRNVFNTKSYPPNHQQKSLLDKNKNEASSSTDSLRNSYRYF